MQTGEQI